MDHGQKNFFLKKRPSIQFKRKAGDKQGNWNSSIHEQSVRSSQSSDTEYRILCPSRKIGGVIGKSGSIVNSLREETRTKITVFDSVPGSEERVIIICSSVLKVSWKQNADGEEYLRLHCAAQDALLKVHDRIVEEDLSGGVTFGNGNNFVTARLLVPNGDVIQRLRSETGASICVLSADHLPTCAMGTDKLVQVMMKISGKRDVAKKALYEVSTLLYQNPQKDKPPSFLMLSGGQGFHPPGTPKANMLPPGNPMWSHQNPPPHGMPPIPWMGGFENQPSGYVPGGINNVPPVRDDEASAEFFMKILCSAEKIGGVIGKGGFNVKQLQQESGASIHVQDASGERDERVIRVSAFEALSNPRSQTIEAILQLQNKTSEFSEKGTIIRLLVPSGKVGCILGQGGHVINEMRRRTRADIRVFSQHDKPRAAEDEALVQISGNFEVAKDALAEIATRLRTRTLRDANAGSEHTSVGLANDFCSARSLPGGPPPPNSVQASSFSGYDPFKVGHEYESRRCPIPSAAPRKYTDFNGVIGEGRSSISKISEVGGARLKLQDFRSGGFEGAVKIHSSDQLNAARSILQACIDSAGQNTYLQHGAYENVNAKQGSYQTMNTQQRPYQMKARQSPYELSAQQGAYNTNAPLPKVPTNTNYSFSSILSFSENSSSHFVQHNANINTFLNAIIA